MKVSLSRRFSGSGGFTLVEVVVVTGLILLLSLVAVPMTDLLNQRDDEERLRLCLLDMRSAIDRYQQQNGTCPACLADLLYLRDADGAHFLRRIPINPLATEPLWQIASRTTVSGVGDTWLPAPIVPLSASDGVPGGKIIDIRCASGTRLSGEPFPVPSRGINGIPFCDW